MLPIAQRKRDGSFTAINRCRRAIPAAASVILLASVACNVSASASCVTGPAGQASPIASPALERLPRLEETAMAYVDLVNGAKYRRKHTYIVTAGPLITISGWAVDSKAMSPAGAVMAQVDQNSFRMADYCLDRPDVAVFYRQPKYSQSGFTVRIPTSGYKPGSEHIVRILVINADKTGEWLTVTTVPFVITDQQLS